jgi:hypothetical protein
MDDAEGETAEGETAEGETAEGECAEGDITEGDIENEQTLDIPFPFSAVDVALERKYSFDEWDTIIACASYLGIVFPENVILVSKLVTLEIVRASGVNPFHFREASFFTTMLSNHDTRLMCLDPVEIEKMYWMVVRSNTNLEYEIRDHLGNDAYASTVKKARELRTQYTNPHRHMTSLGRVFV